MFFEEKKCTTLCNIIPIEGWPQPPQAPNPAQPRPAAAATTTTPQPYCRFMTTGNKEIMNEPKKGSSSSDHEHT
jgi:hypothetical protein